MRDINSMGRGIPWPQRGATQCHAQLGLLDEGRAIKRLIVCNDWDLEPLDLALCCYQPSRKVYKSYTLSLIFTD